MLKELTIENFKGFKNESKIKFAPITVIYGPNSAGKSSIIHALMLLQQSLAKPTKTSGLVSNGEMIDLGSYLTMVNSHKTDLDITFKINYTPVKYAVSALDGMSSSFGSKHDREHTFVYSFYKTIKDNKEKSFSYLKGVNFVVKNSDKSKGAENILQTGFTSRLALASENNIKDALELAQKFTYTTLDDAYAHSTYIAKRLKSLEKHNEGLTRKIFDKVKVSSFVREPTFATPSAVNSDINLSKSGDPVLLLSEIESGRSLYDVSREAKDKLNTISYLGPLRSYPARIYSITEDYKSSVGKLGENIATFLYIDEDQNLLKNINDTFSSFKIPYELEIDALGRNEISGNVVSIKLFDKRTEVMVAPSDVGFGIGQILPILVEGWSKTESIICVEQPEIHLHPRLQAELAEYFCDTYLKKNNQWIIETHSEALMLRLQKLIRNKVITADMISVLYVDSDNDGTYVNQIRLDTKGNFRDIWPDGFFEERMDELFGE